MKAEILAIGTELLLGATIDTNSAWIAERLAAAGIDLWRKNMVGDNRARIAACLRESLERADLVICTGGLGPTVDDVTREAVADALDRPLEFRQELMDQILARYAASKREMPISNRQQAYIPTGARAIHNDRGTAPAFLVEDARGTVIVLPGVPYEMRHLFETAVLPYLRDERGVRDIIVVRTLHAVGMGESVIGEKIADLMEWTNPTVGISAKNGRCELRIGAKASGQTEANALIDRAETIMRERLGDVIVGTQKLNEAVWELLQERSLSLAIYDSVLHMPVVHELGMPPASASALFRGVLLEAPTPPTVHSLADLAQTRAQMVRAQWSASIGLAACVMPQPQESGFTEIAVAVAGDGIAETVVKLFDLRIADAWQMVGTAALDTLRRALSVSLS